MKELLLRSQSAAEEPRGWGAGVQEEDSFIGMTLVTSRVSVNLRSCPQRTLKCLPLLFPKQNTLRYFLFTIHNTKPCFPDASCGTSRTHLTTLRNIDWARPQ